MSSRFMIMLLLLLVEALAEVAQTGGHGSVPALGVSARGLPVPAPIYSLQPAYRQPSSGFSPGLTDHFSGHSAYRIELREPFVKNVQ